MIVGPPATRTDEYLAAILDELRALRVAVEDGAQGQEPAGQQPVEAPDLPGPMPEAKPPAKRTRQRSR